MYIEWHIDKEDVRKLKQFLKEHRGSALVIERKRSNLAKSKPRVRKERFWKALVYSLLTTQQPSGPGSKVVRLMRQRPFPLTYHRCAGQRRLASYARSQISKAGARFGPRLGGIIEENFKRLEDGLWDETRPVLEQLRSPQTVKLERAAADFIADRLKGFGPKQSRNLLQMLGLTRWEIPLDSRLTKWLNDFGFPVRLSGSGLADRYYYCFVLDAFQTLCRAARQYPCVVDAAIFASFDKGTPQKPYGL